MRLFLYKSTVGPQLEARVQMWSPHLRNDGRDLGKVRKRAAGAGDGWAPLPPGRGERLERAAGTEPTPGTADRGSRKGRGVLTPPPTRGGGPAVKAQGTTGRSSVSRPGWSPERRAAGTAPAIAARPGRSRRPQRPHRARPAGSAPRPRLAAVPAAAPRAERPRRPPRRAPPPPSWPSPGPRACPTACRER